MNGYAEQGLDGRWHVFKRPGLTFSRQPTGGAATGLGLRSTAEGSSPLSFFYDGVGNVQVYRANTLITTAASAGDVFSFTRTFDGAASFAEVAIGSTAGVLLFAENGDAITVLQVKGTVIVRSSDTVNTSAVVNVTTAGLRKHSAVSGTGIPADTLIASIDSSTQLTLTNAATATGTNNLTYTLAGPPDNITTTPASLNRSLYIAGIDLGIWGTDLDDPTAWDPLNVIYAYARPEGVRSLATQLSTIVVFKATTTEFFRDAGTTPAPLQRVEGLFLDVGLQGYHTLVEVDDTLLWSSAQRSLQSGVWMMTKLGAKEISTPAVRRLLDEHRFSAQYGMALVFRGHTFYILAIDGVPAQVYDITSGLWYQWTALGEVDWPFRGAAMGNTGGVFLQHRSNGKIYRLDDEVFTDDGLAIDMDIYPPEFDGGTRKGKYLARMYINGDQVEGSELKLRVSDDNQLSWSNYRLFDLGHSRPWIEHCGTFTKRFFHFRHSSPTACKLNEVELEMQVGVL